MVVADSGNGASNVLDWGSYLFINTELTVHFAARAGRRVGAARRARRRSPRAARGSRARCSATGRDRSRAARRRCSSRRAESAHGGLRASASASAGSGLRLRLRLGFRRPVRPGRRRARRARRARRVIDDEARLVPDRVRAGMAAVARDDEHVGVGRRLHHDVLGAARSARELRRASRRRAAPRRRRAAPARPRRRARSCARIDLLVAAPARAGHVDVATCSSVTSVASSAATASTHASQPPSVIHASTFRSRATARR